MSSGKKTSADFYSHPSFKCQVVQLTRLRRASAVTSPSTKQIPLLIDNILYDMDSTTSSSSSDSDASPKERFQTPDPKLQEGTPHCIGMPRSLKSAPPKSSTYSVRRKEPASRPPSPLQEISPNQKSELELRRKPVSSTADKRMSRRRTQIGSNSKDATPRKRWV